jgi:TP901 family phage tail tape measure protein
MATSVTFDIIGRDRASAAARSAGKSLDTLSGRATSATSRLAGLARGMGLAFGGAAIASGITKTIGLAMDFDKTMRTVAVQTGVTGQGIQRLGDLAKEMGQKTIFSAQDAGQAMLELAKGGLSAADIRAGALNETLRLAAAGGLDLASSAGVIANGLNMFGLRADQADQVTTALAGAANKSTASVDSLRMALSQVGPGARTAGLSIQETVAALAEFDNAGIKGSDAGTSLKTMLQRLVPTTTKAATAMDQYNLSFKDSHGNFLSLAQIAENLRKHLGNLSEVQKVQALNTIFGSDASRAAAILMRGGAKQVQVYTKAANDQVATQKMANVAMKGASGAWENFKGTLETSAITLGQKALPAVEDMLNKGNEFLQSADKWGPGVASDFGMVAGAVKTAAGVIKPLAELAGALAKGFQALPGPIKETGVAVGIAALVWPKLQAAAVGALTTTGSSLTTTSAKLSQFRSEMTYSATRAQALQGAMRSAAGPAGMGLMIATASTGNQTLKTLGTVGGGALMGFAAGGPIGGAIGAGAGLLGVMASNMNKAADAAKASKADYSGLASTLDSLTGSTTSATRAFILDQLQRSGALKNLNAYNISSRTAVNAILGESKARKVVSAAISNQRSHYQSLLQQIKDLEAQQQQTTAQTGARARTQTADQVARAKQIESLKAQAAQEKNVLNAVRDGMGVTKSSIAQKRRDIMATQDLAGKLKGIPKNVRSKIEATGIMPTAKGIAAVARRYHLLPKQIKTLIAATGVDASVKQVEKAKQHLEALSKTKPNMANFNEAVRRSGAVADNDAKRAAKAIQGSLEKGPKDSKANLAAFQASIRNGAEAARGIASTGGHSVGEALSSGVQQGFSGTGAKLAAQAAAAVNQAIAAARHAADAHSPSRKMAKLGHDLMDGLVEGIADREMTVQNAMQRVQSIIDKASTKISNLMSTRSGFLGTFQSDSIFGTDMSAGGDIGSLIAAQQGQAGQASQLLSDVKSVTKMGLSKALVRQLRSQGTSGAAALHAIAMGSPDQIRQLNQLNKQTSESLRAAGLRAGNYARGGSINDDIRTARKQEHVLELLEHRLHELAQTQKKDQTIIVEIDGEALIKAVRRRNTRKGVKSANL